jgi:nucleoside-diphosphate-sugar epimerase
MLPRIKSCVVLGGSSQIGSWLAPALIAKGWTVHLISRGLKPQPDYGSAATWHSLNLRTATPFPEIDASVAFDTIGNVDECVDRLRTVGVDRVITFSSTSVFTKASSPDPGDRQSVEEIKLREDSIIRACNRAQMRWTIFRPTLIYGGKFGDRTVNDIARVIRTFRFFPVFGDAKGLRQPVHADDLAAACIAVMENPAAFDRCYNIGGGEVLPYRAMIERIFVSMGREPRFVRIPLPAFELAAKALRQVPRYRHITASMATRMQQDMVFGNEDAEHDFGYSPRRFLPTIHLEK